MEVEYIKCFASHNWRKMLTDITGGLVASFILLIYKKDDVFNCESRVVIADPVSKLQTTEQNKSPMKDLSQCISLFKKLNELMPSENNSIDIFKFNSKDDFPHFLKWIKQRNDFLNLELENMH